MGSNTMLMTLAAHLRPYKRWELVGVSAFQTGATIAFPSTAQAGDVAILSCTGTGSTTPSGWTQINAGSANHWYRLCSGGESSVASAVTGGGGAVTLFRPKGGPASFYTSVSDFPQTNRTIALPAASACLIVGTGHNSASVSWSGDPVMPLPYTTHIQVSTNPALRVASSLPPIGTSTTGAMNINAQDSVRQQFCVFTI